MHGERYQEVRYLPEERSGILLALKLCYHHLPSHLKRCFAYCSKFPKDYEFDKDELILLWMAKGFLQHAKGVKRLEDLGPEYFYDLFSRSFFQQSSHSSSSFLMHDLINDLSQFIARETCFNLEDKLGNEKQTTIYEKARHSSFIRQYYNRIEKLGSFLELKFLRTLLALPSQCIFQPWEPHIYKDGTRPLNHIEMFMSTIFKWL